MNRNLFLTIVFLFNNILLTQEGNQIIIPDAPNIFIDCFNCDLNYIRESIKFVNFVRDRKDADIHILFSSQSTGGGGLEYTLKFIGQNKFEGIQDELKFVKLTTDSPDNEREKIVKTIKLGLIQFVAKTPIADKINIDYLGNFMITEKIEDNWDNWFLKASINSYFNGEKSYRYVYLNGSFSAARITELWKLSISINTSYNESKFDYGTISTLSISRGHSLSFSLLKKISEHWGVGVWTNANSSTYSNIDFSAQLMPGVEYNVFPYSEYTSRELKLQYRFAADYNRYVDETIFFKTKELLFFQKLSVILEFIKNWGSVRLSVSGSSYIHDFDKNSIEVYSNISLMLIKGLALNFNIGYSGIHNQLSLPRYEASVEDVLLRQRELETQYYYWGSIGISYSFGSIYNNIVNPIF
ncbi:MAG: hypothetical protein JW866_11140 [Ignavibacteriales bacterium]|nr:hypothetical protein [Ignavibacteriales bacterium]